jgi:hypothetical protein
VKTTNPEPFLPARAPKPLTDAHRRLAEAIEADAQSAAAAREAKLAADAAPDADDAAAVRAREAGKEPPAPTVAKRQAECEAAERRAKADRQLYHQRAAEFNALLIEHRAELAKAQAPRVDAAHAEVAKAVDLLEVKLRALAQEAAAMRAAYWEPSRGSTPAEDRARAMGRMPAPQLPQVKPAALPRKELAALRSIAEDMRTGTVPLRHRILEAIGEQPTRWDEAVASLNLDRGDADAERNALVAEGTLRWCDAEGNPAPASSGLLRRGARYATARERGRARREARQRKAA